MERNNKDQRLLIKGTNAVILKIKQAKYTLDNFVLGFQGEINVSTKKKFFKAKQIRNSLPLLRGNNIGYYTLISEPEEFCVISISNRRHYHLERVIFQEVSNAGLDRRIKAVLLKNYLCGHTTNYIFSKKINSISNKILLGILNSSLFNYYFKFFNQTNHVAIGEIKSIPLPDLNEKEYSIEALVNKILSAKKQDPHANTSLLEKEIDIMVYHLYKLTYEEAKIIEPALSEEDFEKYKLSEL